MKYTVVWKPAAERQLARLWTGAPDAAAIAAAADKIDALLKRNPWNQGESRSATRRVTIERPLVTFFEISEADKLVEVLHVRKIGT